ncbi:hypothetical protein HYN59_04170 [Flavobacterium album]|uniref:DUF5689 domain-containing protein n=1 Tax=Flavobacterium album TaxID=2175091 RepID=A0A2S1QVI5_9FLAO|nr:DUF5689 domain-containing protein [Flavobacterium album]AWH84359.1 hypothetical protein HYN59_04170 [Flavobacterium album]
MKFSKYLLIGALSAGFLTGCANDDDYDAPVMECINPGLTVTKSVSDILATATATPTQYTQDDIIEAYVTSSDERGAFFKIVSLQTHPTDGSAPIGFSINIDGAGLFTQGFVPGTKVMIKLKDLYYGIDFGSLEIGALFEGQVGRISEQTYKDHIFVNTCEKLEEADLVTHMTVAQALNDANINRLIELDNVEFLEASFGYKLYDESAPTANGNNPQTIGGATNHQLIDQEGNKIVFRTSSFANFSGMKIPEGSGKVRGVLTKFLDTYQFVARYDTDIKLDQPRFTPVENSASALGGTAIAYSGSFTEDFESYTAGLTTFPKYVNDYTTGGRYWQLKSFSNNEYIEMSSFNGAGNQGVTAKTYFFVPVNFDAASTFSFDKEIRYMAGQCLKVYRADAGTYIPRTAFNVANFVDITSQFTGLTYPATGQSQNTFSTAGTYNIPASVTGNGFIVFEYSGGGTVTTTVQIDNISAN